MRASAGSTVAVGFDVVGAGGLEIAVLAGPAGVADGAGPPPEQAASASAASSQAAYGVMLRRECVIGVP